MPWSAGVFNRLNGATGWVDDANAFIGIEATRHDTQDNDFRDGINNCLAKDGTNAATGNLNFGGNYPTNIGAGTAAAPALCAGNDVNTGIFSAAADQIGIATNGTEKIRIDATGNVGIGTTSPGSVVDVHNALAVPLLNTYRNDAAGSGVFFQKSRSATVGTNTIVQNGDALGSIYFNGANGTGYSEAALIRGAVDGTPGATNDMPGRLLFYTTPDGSGTLTERMRINSAGNVGIGVASFATARLGVRGSSTASDTVIYCQTNGGGDLFYVQNNGYIATGLQASSPYNNTAAVSANLHVAGDGILYRATSSLKYKKDVKNMPYGLAEVLQLRPVVYKGTSQLDGDKVYGGLIAEEVHEQNLGEFVQYAQDGSPDALAYGNMVSLAFKAIQELNAKVEALEARVADLEP